LALLEWDVFAGELRVPVVTPPACLSSIPAWNPSMLPTRFARWVCCCQLLLGMALVGCGKQTPTTTAKTESVPAKEVAVVRARVEAWPLTIPIQGSMLAFEDSVVGSKLAGRVNEIPVDLGSVVRKGAVLMKLVRSELDLRVELAEAQLKQACATIGITPSEDETKFDAKTAPGVAMEQALVNEAQRTVNRAKQLLSSRAVTEQEFDTMVAQLQAAQARYNAALNLVGEQISLIGVRRKELALAEQAVKDSEVVAPFDGVVGERLVSPGEFVGVGQAVVTLVRSNPLRFTAGVPESRAAEIHVGQKVDIKQGLNVPNPISTTISRVSPTVMQATRSILIEADVSNESLELQAGLFAEAEVVVNPGAQAIVLPLSAMSRFAGVQKVWLVENDIARQQTIRTGREASNRVEIVDGLSEGQIVVLDASEGHDGPIIPREQYSDVDSGEEAPPAPTSAVGGEVTRSTDTKKT
jgi:membrane fusion protein (multidrug efflux system)